MLVHFLRCGKRVLRVVLRQVINKATTVGKSAESEHRNTAVLC